MKTLKYGRPVVGFVAAAILTCAMGSRAGAQSGSPQPPPQSPGPSLPLSMAQAVAMALDANLDLRAEKLNLDVASHSIAIAKASFLPQVQATTGHTSSKSVPSDFTQGTQDIVGKSVSLNGSVRQETPWHGSSYFLTYRV